MKELKAWHAFTILGGFFAVMIAVNAVFVTYALATFTGEDMPTPYLRGLAYNKTLDERAAQRELGWHIAVAVTREAKGAVAEVTITDRAGAPQSYLDVIAVFRRPTDADLDAQTPLAATSDGRYRGSVASLAPGQWDVVVKTKTPAGEPLEATRRILLP